MKIKSPLRPLGLLLAFGLVATVAAGSKRPNVLMICIDDLRPVLGCYGANEVLSPNLDRLAGQAVVFNNAYCNVPVCGASRASLMTSIRPDPTRFKTYLSKAETDTPGSKSIAQLFKENGYYTLSNGKVFHHPDDLDEESWSEPAWRPKTEQGQTFNPENEGLVHPRFNWGVWREAGLAEDDAYFDGQVMNKTLEDLRKLAEKDQPFFLAAGFFKPHLPLNAPAKYFENYDPEQLTLAANREPVENAPKSLNGSVEIKYYHHKGVELNSEEFHQKTIEAYYACVTFVDALVGQILDELERLKLADDTIIVVWGDHGWNLGEHNYWGKHNLLRNATRIPFMIKAPGYDAGVHTDNLAELVDLLPTLCELADIDTGAIRNQIHGNSLVPSLQNPNGPGEDYIVTKFRNGDQIVTSRYSYTEYRLKDGSVENMLFDHEKDPNEDVNIAALPEYAPVVKKLSEKLEPYTGEISYQ